jgi:hypothetical protein
MTIAFSIVGLLIFVMLGAGTFLATAMRWLISETGDDRYFKRSLEERRALKQEIRRRAPRVLSVLVPLAKLMRMNMPVTVYQGTHAPKQVCPLKTFAAATQYEPGARDIFVATQMKCGTTWMQQIVYEILSHGRGSIGEDGGPPAMYALSPWIESRGAVSMEDAIPVGERKQHIIKTHFPTRLCPYSEEARYIYVTRHPVACFSSTADFVGMLAGPLAPPRAELLEWFCSDEMWWRSWPEHVDGWWQWAQEKPNVLFCHYEEMLDDPGRCVDQVASFLDVELSSDERAEVVRKSSYAYMKEREEFFEMSAPSYLTGEGGTFFRSGSKKRESMSADDERERILSFCRDRLADSTYPVARFYPDVASG